MTDADTWRNGMRGGDMGWGRREDPGVRVVRRRGGMGLMVWTDVGICACAQGRDTERNNLHVSEGGEVG